MSNKTAKLLCWVEPDLLREAKAAANSQGISTAELVRRALQRYLRPESKEPISDDLVIGADDRVTREDLDDFMKQVRELVKAKGAA